mgnify:CR=1 FL=1
MKKVVYSTVGIVCSIAAIANSIYSSSITSILITCVLITIAGISLHFYEKEVEDYQHQLDMADDYSAREI